MLLKTKKASYLQKNGFSVSFLSVFSAVTYNAFLAIINANIIALNMHFVVISEIVILSGITIYIVHNAYKLKGVMLHLVFFALMSIFSIIVMAAHEETFIKFIRDMYIVVIFVLLGMLTSKKDIINIFKTLATITLIMAFVEIFKTNLYISLFEPAQYYENTRGVAPYGSSGLFRGSILFDNRFSFNFVSNHRISSIFLEQVSLANFSMVLSIFVTTFWNSITKKERLFFIITIILLILSNDTRTGALFALMLVPGFFVFPLLPRNLNVLIIPAVLFVAAIFFYDPYINSHNWEDNIKGRIGLTLFLLSEINIATVFFGKSGTDAMQAMDSGYAYVIYAVSLLGFVTYWLYTSLLVSLKSYEAKRYAYAVSLFIAVNLTVSAAIFTIKIAALLWIMGGFLYNKHEDIKSNTNQCFTLKFQGHNS